MNVEFLEPLIDIVGNTQAVTEVVARPQALTLLFPLVAALAVSMALIPLMVRLAPVLGMIDAPDPRKVHVAPVPRVGGFGIVIGTLLPLLLLLPQDQSHLSFIAGGMLLFIFGALDDAFELGHYVKFVGQFIAVVTVVYAGDVYATQLPFTGGEPISDATGRVFTVFAMVGMINAINHSDGLDGLAGGESLMSLGCIAWLAWLAGGQDVTIVALATIGGLFGFMRFNTHPARIFMGDGGSQFLGFTLGYLAVRLTQEVNPVLSPALPALILGLPIADIIMVLFKRARGRMNWFRATRNHVHHRLLDLGFRHYESVVIVYSVQALLVMCAVLMPYESDLLVAGTYLGIVAVVFLALQYAEHRHWRVRTDSDSAYLDAVIGSAVSHRNIREIPYRLVSLAVPLFLLAGSFATTEIPVDFMLFAPVLFVLLLIRLLAGYRVGFLSLRLLVYITIVFIVYLLNNYQPPSMAGADPLTYLFFGVLAGSIAVAIRFSGSDNFTVTPTDYLIVLIVLILALLANSGMVDSGTIAVVLKSIILFYGCELILGRVRGRWNLLTGAVLLSLLVVTLRGVMINILTVAVE